MATYTNSLQQEPRSRLGNRFARMPFLLFLPLLPVSILGIVGLAFLIPNFTLPENIPGWVFLFGLPHIISSIQTSADIAYFRAYKKLFLISLIILSLPTIVFLSGVPTKYVFILYFILTANHVISQQYGIVIALTKARPSLAFRVSKSLMLLLGIMAYLEAYFLVDLTNEAWFTILEYWVSASFPVLFGVIFLTSFYHLILIREKQVAALFFTVNTAVFLVSVCLIFKTEFSLLGLIFVRVLHDCSAFIIYILHDITRNKSKRHNVIYQLFPKLSIALLNPLLALSIAGLLTFMSLHLQIVVWLIMGITLVHYYLEKNIWKGDTPHRKHFAFD